LYFFDHVLTLHVGKCILTIAYVFDTSHVQAAYASFLWDTEEENDAGCNDSQCLPQHFHLGAMATTGA